MNAIQLSKGLGFFSLGLGALELLAGQALARRLGLPSAALIRAFGARELAAGMGVLTFPDRPMPVWNRVVGDALDLAVLAPAVASGNPRRGAARVAMAAVLGATVLDVVCAVALGARQNRALATARRSRVKTVKPRGAA